MTSVYQIIGWNDNFETASTRKLQRPCWVSVPTRQSGKGITRILAQADGAAIFGIWVLIVQACTQQRMPRDGWLTDDGTPGGPPWTVDDLAERWRRPHEEIARALEVLCSGRVAWVKAWSERADNLPVVRHPSATHPPSPPTVEESRGEERREGAGAGAQPAPLPGLTKKPSDLAQVQKYLARLRFASDETALQEWWGLLTLEGHCGSLREAMDCLQWLKATGQREGIASRYASAYEALARRWDERQAAAATKGQA